MNLTPICNAEEASVDVSKQFITEKNDKSRFVWSFKSENKDDLDLITDFEEKCVRANYTKYFTGKFCKPFGNHLNCKIKGKKIRIFTYETEFECLQSLYSEKGKSGHLPSSKPVQEIDAKDPFNK